MTEREMALRGRAPAPHQPPVNNRYFSRKWGVLYISVYSTIYNVVTCQVRIYNHYINAHIAIVSTVYCYIITCVSTMWWSLYDYSKHYMHSYIDHYIQSYIVYCNAANRLAYSQWQHKKLMIASNGKKRKANRLKGKSSLGTVHATPEYQRLTY